MTYPPSSSDFPLVRFAGVGVAGLEGRTLTRGAGRGLSPLRCCLGRDLRLIEVTETICKRLLDYSLHKERTGSNRFAKVGLARPSSCWARLRVAEPVCRRGCDGQILPEELPSLASPSSSRIAVCTPPLLGGLTFPW